ncbi:unnamed protein product [Paramecium primaurelia]|uniref:Cyclic nucleotide-binding domain-containing protein n=1 Tax=Paramecium primaurelia TaxID=5886 RepID=A0A8S1K2W7_PARPR|nr:unnamed protein product [Paramecium primaurelia]
MQQEQQILVQLLSASDRIPELICKYLQEVPFLRQFDQTQGHGFMKKLAALVQFKIYQQDEIILEQGRPVNSLYLFMYGLIGKHQTKRDKNYEIVQEKNAIGEIYFLTRQACKYWISALKPSLICYVTKDNFYKIVKKKNITMSLLNELLQYPFFSQLSISFIEQICQKSQTVNYINHQIVFDIDQEANSWYIVLQGEFQILFQHQKKFYPLILLSQGDYFGEIEIVQKSMRQYRIQCISNEATLLEINKLSFSQLMIYDSQFKIMINQNIQNRINSYDEIIKQNILTLSIPLSSRRSRSKMHLKSIHLKIKSTDTSIEPNVQEFQSEREKALLNLMESKIVKKESKKTLYQRLREQNPRLLQFLEKMEEIKQSQQKQQTSKKFELIKQLPSIQSNPLVDSIQSYSHTPLFSFKGDSPIRIRQLTKSRNQNSNSSVHTLQQTQEILTNMGQGKYFKLLFHKKET